MFQDEKIVVTDEALDDWMAQLYGFSIYNLPKRKPVGMP
jgi:hypothetical protein